MTSMARRVSNRVAEAAVVSAAIQPSSITVSAAEAEPDSASETLMTFSGGSSAEGTPSLTSSTTMMALGTSEAARTSVKVVEVSSSSAGEIRSVASECSTMTTSSEEAASEGVASEADPCSVR